MDPTLLQRAWGAWQQQQQEQQQPSAAAAAIATAATAIAGLASGGEAGEAAAAAGYFYPLAPPVPHHLHPFGSHAGGGVGGEDDVRFELLMTGVASLVIVGVWVVGLLLWYKQCVERPPRLFCGAVRFGGGGGCVCVCLSLCGGWGCLSAFLSV